MYCQNCGTQLETDARFCKACGAAAGSAPQPFAPVFQQPAAKATNSLALIGLILSFFVPIVGLIVSIIARKQCTERGEEGEKMAKAGIIVGAIYSVILAVIVIAAMAISFIAFSTTFDASIMPDIPGMI